MNGVQVCCDFQERWREGGICHYERKCDVNQHECGCAEIHTVLWSTLRCLQSLLRLLKARWIIHLLRKKNIWITQEQWQIPFKFHLIWLAQVHYSFSESWGFPWPFWIFLCLNYNTQVQSRLACALFSHFTYSLEFDITFSAYVSAGHLINTMNMYLFYWGGSKVVFLKQVKI